MLFKIMRIVSTVCFFIVGAVTSAPSFTVEEVADGLGVPWGMTFIGDSTLLFTERGGQVKKLDLLIKKITKVRGGPRVYREGQGGMLDVAVDGEYDDGDWIYFTYAKKVQGGGATTLARAKLKRNRLNSWQDLKVTRSASDSGLHFGSRIAFDGEGHLFFTVGDRGDRSNGQNLNTHAGSILRLNLDGSTPSDNPFSNSEALSEIWSYGHRNPQGIAYDRKTQRLWSIEHGPRGGDEINLILPGKNYGWPVVSHGQEYWGPVPVGESTHKKGMEDPTKVYIPSIAPGSLLLYSTGPFQQWKGNLFAGALKLKHLNRIGLDKNGKAVEEERLLLKLDERLRALAISPQGLLYISTDSGTILRLVP